MVQVVREQDIPPHKAQVLDTDPTEKSLWWAVRYVVSIRTNRVLILVSALGYFFFSGLRTFAVVFLRDRFGITQGVVASILLVVIGVGAIVGVLATGRLGDWLIERRHITARPLVGGLSFLLAAAVPARAAHHLPAGRRTVAVLRRSRGRRANPPLDAARLDLMHSRLWGAP